MAVTLRSSSGLIVKITDRQLEILRMLADGYSTREIVVAIRWSERTVKGDIERMMTELGARNRIQLMAILFRAGVFK